MGVVLSATGTHSVSNPPCSVYNACGNFQKSVSNARDTFLKSVYSACDALQNSVSEARGICQELNAGAFESATGKNADLGIPHP